VLLLKSTRSNPFLREKGEMERERERERGREGERGKQFYL
jgi:hypothetical protein